MITYARRSLGERDMLQGSAHLIEATTAEAVVGALVANGVGVVFGLPGVQNNHLFDAFYKARSAIRLVHTRHEQGAAYMALGAALASGEPQVYAVVPGAGVLNTTAALATAYSCSAPVLCLAGQIPSAMIDRGFGYLHEVNDQLGILRRLTKWAERIDSPSDGAAKANEAFRLMRAGRPRPVALECPLDVWPVRGAVEPARPLAVARMSVDEDAVAAAARLLGAARRPLIVVGGGAQDAADEVLRIAELLQAPVAAHRMGRGVLDARHPLSVGPMLGDRLWHEADAILAIGTRLQIQGTRPGRAQSLVRIDVDADEMGLVEAPAVGLLGDAGVQLRALADKLPGRMVQRPSRHDEILRLRAAAARELGALEPMIAFLEAIRAELPEDGIFVDEMTQLAYAARLAFPVYRPRTYLSPGYQGTLGWGVAAAIGAKVARPDAPVVVVTGDGGFLFNVQELATAAHHDISIVVVLINDGAFGNVRRQQETGFGGRVFACELTNPDFVRLAESFGASAVRARTPAALRRALRRAFATGGSTLIEVPVVGELPNPWRFLRGERLPPPAGGAEVPA